MLKEYTCIVCPNGCEIRAQIEDGCITDMEGALCMKGEAYVRQEILEPKRTIATSVAVKGGEFPLSSVRTTQPIPKEMICQVMAEIRKVTVDAPTTIGQVIIANVLDTGSDVIITKENSSR